MSKWNVSGEAQEDIVDLYWNSDIPVAEIAEAYNLPDGRVVCEVAGPAHVNGISCARCKGPITVYSRTALREERWLRWVNLKTREIVCDECEDKDRKISAELNQIERELREMDDRNRLQDLRTMPYREYLQTDEWKETRADALRAAEYRCQLCCAGGRLHVHHRTYVRRGDEHIGDLIVLCAECHETFHRHRKLAENGRALSEWG